MAPIPRDRLQRHAWILYQLKVQHRLSVRAFAREIGRSATAVLHVVGGAPSNEVEQLLAERLGVSQRDLFPEHFDSSGRRIRLVMTSGRKPTAPEASRNVQTRGAA